MRGEGVYALFYDSMRIRTVNRINSAIRVEKASDNIFLEGLSPAIQSRAVVQSGPGTELGAVRRQLTQFKRERRIHSSKSVRSEENGVSDGALFSCCNIASREGQLGNARERVGFRKRAGVRREIRSRFCDLKRSTNTPKFGLAALAPA